MLAAFTPTPLVELRPRDRSRIGSFLAFGDRILVGLHSGALRVYRLNQVGNGNGGDNTFIAEGNSPSKATDGTIAAPTNPVKPVDLLRELDRFSRYRIEHLALIREADILVSLSGGYVSLYSASTFEPLYAPLLRSRGATALAVTYDAIENESTGRPVIMSRLAVAAKRKVLLWTWRDNELVEPEEAEKSNGDGADVDAAAHEFTLVSGIRTLVWVSVTRLVAGLGAGYVLLDVESGQVSDLSGPGAIGSGGQETGRLGMGSYIGLGGGGPRPLATPLAPGHLVLARDTSTHYVNTDGATLGRPQVPWSIAAGGSGGAPHAVGYSYPYLLSLQDPSKGELDIWNPETQSLLQSIHIPSANILHVPAPHMSLPHAGRGFLVGSDRAIWRMLALDYNAQVDALAERGKLDEAISLLGMLEEHLVRAKPGRMRALRLQKARTLFGRRKFRDALDLFAEVSAPPEIVIPLYPRPIAGELASDEQPEAEKNADNSTNTHNANGAGTGGESSSSADSQQPQKQVTYAESVTSFIRGRSTEEPPSSGPVADKKLKRLQGKELEAAVRELRAFLADIRRRLGRFFDADGTPLAQTLLTNANARPEPKGANEAEGEEGTGAGPDPFAQSVVQVLGVLPEDTDDEELARRLVATSCLVDTTLFRAYMFTNPALAGSLFRVANHCDPKVVVERLEDSGRYNDLIEFLYGKGLHLEALELLRRFGEGSEEKKGEGEGEKGESEQNDEGAVPSEEKTNELERGKLSEVSAQEPPITIPEQEATTEQSTLDPAASDSPPSSSHPQESTLRAQSPPKPHPTIPPELRGPARTVAYLQHLPPTHLSLILTFAAWPIRVAPDLGMEIFLADTENAETLPRGPVLDFLLGLHGDDEDESEDDIEAGQRGREGRRLAVRYLEHVVGELGDMDPEMHERLLVLYLEQMAGSSERDKEGKKNGEGEKAGKRMNNQTVMSKFLDMLDRSEQYSPSRMLWLISRDDPNFYEARAIVLSKMGCHRKALEIYVFKLKDPVKAEEYCNRIYRLETQHKPKNSKSPPPTAAVEHARHPFSTRTSSTSSSPSGPRSLSLSRRPSSRSRQHHRHLSLDNPQTVHDTNTDELPSPSAIYHTLLSLYLTPPPPHTPQPQPALALLARHGGRLPASTATLALLPATLPVLDLAFYFRGRMRAATSARNRGRVELGLRRVLEGAMAGELAMGGGQWRGGVGGDGGAAAAAGTGEWGEVAVGGQSRSVVVRDDRVCGVCHKRLGGSVICVFPDNTVVHLGCVNRVKHNGVA